MTYEQKPIEERCDLCEAMRARIQEDPDVRAASQRFDTLMDSAMRFAKNLPPLEIKARNAR